MNVNEAISRQRAVRSYSGAPIAADLLDRILDAGRRAQSSRNSQPWRFIVVEQADTLTELSRLGNHAGHLAQAAAGIVILTPDPASNISVMFDAGQAAAYMQLVTLELGLGSCIVKLHRPDPARTLLGFPDDLYLNFVIAVGYPDNPFELASPPSQGARQPLEELASFEYWRRSRA